MSLKLNLPHLLDLTSKNTTKIKIKLTKFKFSPNAKSSGVNNDKTNPIFGSCFCNGKKKLPAIWSCFGVESDNGIYKSTLNNTRYSPFFSNS